MKLGDFLNTMAAKIGAQQDQSLIDLLSSSELANREIADELAQRFDTGLMSLEGAKNNREVLNHLKPIILKAADDKFAVLAEKWGIGNEMQSEPSTYKKIDVLETKLAALLEEQKAKVAKASGNSTENEQKLTKQIGELQAQIAKVTAEKDAEIAAFKKNAEKQALEYLVNTELNGKRYANQDLGDTNVTIARTLIDKALQEQKALLINENGQLKLKQADNPQLDFVDSGFKPVTFSDFANKLLADKHLLEVSEESHGIPGGGGYSIPQKPSTITLGNGKQVDTSRIDADSAASMADLEN